MELWLAFEVPTWDLTGYSAINSAVILVSLFAPVVRNFDRVAQNPEALSLYFALTVLLVIPKTALFFLWLNSSRMAMYRHLVISPLTATSPRRMQEFIEEPLEERKALPEKPRSLASRIVWSLTILVLLSFGAFVILNFGWEVQRGKQHARYAELASVAQGGWALWIHWSLKWTTFMSLLLGIIASIVRDYFVFVQSIVRGDKNYE